MMFLSVTQSCAPPGPDTLVTSRGQHPEESDRGTALLLSNADSADHTFSIRSGCKDVFQRPRLLTLVSCFIFLASSEKSSSSWSRTRPALEVEPLQVFNSVTFTFPERWKLRLSLEAPPGSSKLHTGWMSMC